jgi:peptidoglycan/xylan/chitin deacetylase (PgdA/CDA1 family)
MIKKARRKMKAYMSRINFALNRTPHVINYGDTYPSQYIPEPYRAVFILSADFELAWAWRFAYSREMTERFAQTARKNIPKILSLCDQYRIPITWATVGHLFLERCSTNGHRAHPSMSRIPYHKSHYWSYNRGDWFEHDPCTDYKISPAWYGPDLITMIMQAKTQHEIGCHTFSHIDCSDHICPQSVFIDEINECQRCASRFGVSLKSFVHPGHTIGNLNVLKKCGFTSFRTDYRDVLAYPEKHPSGLWEFKTTAEMKYRKEWSLQYHVYRYTKIIEKALKARRLCYFWFHPSIDSTFVEVVMPALFEFIASRHNILWVTTTSDYVNWLEHHER